MFTIFIIMFPFFYYDFITISLLLRIWFGVLCLHKIVIGCHWFKLVLLGFHNFIKILFGLQCRFRCYCDFVYLYWVINIIMILIRFHYFIKMLILSLLLLLLILLSCVLLFIYIISITIIVLFSNLFSHDLIISLWF